MYGRKVLLLFIALFVSAALSREAAAVGARSLRLGVNDSLTEIEAVPVNGTYYVPLRELAQELDWILTGMKDGIDIGGPDGHLWLALNQGNSITPGGGEIMLDTFKRNGKLMVPLKTAAYLGYTVSFKGEQYVLRVTDSSAILDEAAFIDHFKEELKPPETPAEAAAEPPVTAAVPSGTTVFLTFDDGPTATTGQLLDILSKYEVKATFFMLGPNMNRYPQQVKRMVKEEEGLGLHGLSHRKEKFYSSPAAALAEMDGDNAILQKLAGVNTKLIRTPYGSKPYFTKSFRDKVLVQGYNLWDWNVDSKDWMYKEDSGAIYTSVMDQVHKLRKSKIDPVILMHDQKPTLKVLPRILESLKQEGYQFRIITGDTVPVNFWQDKR